MEQIIYNLMPEKTLLLSKTEVLKVRNKHGLYCEGSEGFCKTVVPNTDALISLTSSGTPAPFPSKRMESTAASLAAI